MSNFHLSVKLVKRSHGNSAVAASAYRSASSLRDERRGTRSNFRWKQHEIAYSDVLYPEKVQVQWTREELWNRAERAERRADSVVAREVNVALVYELPLEDQVPDRKEVGAGDCESARSRHRHEHSPADARQKGTQQGAPEPTRAPANDDPPRDVLRAGREDARAGLPVERAHAHHRVATTLGSANQRETG